MRRAIAHALTCFIRSRWRRWRFGQPFWRDDKAAQALGVAQFGCPRCGRGAMRFEQADES